MKKNKTPENIFSTSDLALVAFLSTSYPIQHIDTTNLRSIVFIFEKDSEFDLLTERYWRGESRIEPVSFSQNLKVLKSRIHNLKNQD